MINISLSNNESILSKKILRVLIIEDSEDRQKILISLYRNCAWVLVHTGRRALTLINAYDFDIISIDYNLADKLNGADVAKAISISRNKTAEIVIHSMNPKGAEKIAKIFPNAIRYPVLKMVRSNVVFKRLREKIDYFGTFRFKGEN